MIFPRLTPKRNEYSNAWELELTEELAYQPTLAQVIFIPRFFSYDGATIPSIGWAAIYSPYDPIVLGPALVHDWIYLTHVVDRPTADSMLKNLLIQNGAPIAKAELIHAAVSAFGGFHWTLSDEDEKYKQWLINRLAHFGEPSPQRYGLVA